MRRGSEVEDMLLAEYDYETDIAVQREEAWEEGMENEQCKCNCLLHSQNECAILGFGQKRAIQLHKLNKRCQTNCLLKRETGVIHVRTRHRILRVKADDHWVTGKGAGASDQ